CPDARGSGNPKSKIQNRKSPDVLVLLTSLVEKSLVIYEEGSGGPRYRLLETMRQYFTERLLESGEDEAVRDRHLAFFLGLAEEAAPHRTGASQYRWLRGLEVEHDNLHAALAWALSKAEGGRMNDESEPRNRWSTVGSLHPSSFILHPSE